MFSEFVQTKIFTKKWDTLGYNDDDLRLLEIDLLEKGDKYPVIKGTGGLRKCRLKLQNKGKSGGSRVLFVNFVKLETIYLIMVYSKNEQEDISEEDKKDFKKLIIELEEEVKKNHE
ncbi:MAG: type II toxin-antitoxin system RelE/ParE family toxin [Lachnospiraceae bacterium]|nr:type II toxin-antitoxin system RelE/ParE family toxin [Lachnospiraceae bacterium]